MRQVLHTIQKKHKKKKLVVFDLDGTLTESKADMDREMAALMTELLKRKKVAVIGGGKYELFVRQLLSKLKISKPLLKNLFLFPTTSTAFYRFGPRGHRQGGASWRRVYSETLTSKERRNIFDAFSDAFREVGYKHPKKIYGKLIEDRGTQVTFSALGQKAPVRLKDRWKKKNSALKLKLARVLQKMLPEFEVRAAGYTSIDVTRKGIDKEYGIRQITKHLRIPLRDMLFVGDALFPGGNDSAVLRTGIPCIQVRGPEDTKKIIQSLL